MDPAQIASLPTLLSSARFAPYLVACSGAADRGVRLYTWNVEVSAAFWGPLHALEVVLRNAMHDRLAAYLGQPDWWTHPRAQLHGVMQRQRNQAVQDAEGVAGRKKRPVVPDDVVAALSFGFWTALLGTGGSLQYETRYWQPALEKAFPNYTGKRAPLHENLDSIRLFRNRVAHHEPVFYRHLAADHATVTRLAGYLSSDAEEWITSHSRVPGVLERRQRVLDTGDLTSF